MKQYHYLLIFLFGLGAVFTIWMVIRPSSLQHFIYEGFDTWIEVDLPARHQGFSNNIATIIQEMDEKWDRFDQKSEIGKINQSQELIEISSQTCDLILYAQELQNRTEGFFHIFLGSLMDEWSFNSNPRLPSSERIQDLIEQIAESTIIINREKRSAQRTGQGKIDLGGIAKGYLVDKIIVELEKKQISPALVNAGGTVFALGKKFRVGVMHPRQESLVGVIEVKNQAVSTSGDYYRFFEQDGIRYYHIINPYTGYPASYFSSVTAVYPNAADADAISTAVMAGGPELIPVVERRFPGVAIIAIQNDEKLVMNDAALKIFQKDSTDKIHP